MKLKITMDVEDVSRETGYVFLRPPKSKRKTRLNWTRVC